MSVPHLLASTELARTWRTNINATASQDGKDEAAMKTYSTANRNHAKTMEDVLSCRTSSNAHARKDTLVKDAR